MLLQTLRKRVAARLDGNSESGFTLIELLVVMLILGILAAIAIPAFFSQKDKAGDAEAKSIANSAVVAAETYATDTANGNYAAMNLTKLAEIEPTLTGAPVVATPTGASNDGYTIVVTSTTGTTFTVTRASTGQISYSCTPAGGGCPTGGNWG